MTLINGHISVFDCNEVQKSTTVKVSNVSCPNLSQML